MKTYTIKSTTSQFTVSLGENLREIETIAGLRADGRGFVKQVSLKALDNNAYRVEMLNSDEAVIASHDFGASDGKVVEISGTDYYCYSQSVEWPLPIYEHVWTQKFAIRNLTNTLTTGAIELTLQVEK